MPGGLKHKSALGLAGTAEIALALAEIGAAELGDGEDSCPSLGYKCSSFSLYVSFLQHL